MEIDCGSVASAFGATQKRKREAVGEASPKTKACHADATSKLGDLQELSPSGKPSKEHGPGLRAAESPPVSGQVAPTRGSLAPAGNRRVQLLHPPSARELAPAGPEDDSDDPEEITAGVEVPHETQRKGLAAAPAADQVSPKGAAQVNGPKSVAEAEEAVQTPMSGSKARPTSRQATAKTADAAAGATATSQEVTCAFCHAASTSQVTGKFVTVDKQGRVLKGANPKMRAGTITAHSKCLEWAPEVFFSGASKIMNVGKEAQRARLLHCTVCSKRGAVLGCFVPKCKRSYHYPCARTVPDCAFNPEQFVMCCPEHASVCPPSAEGDEEEEEEEEEEGEEEDGEEGEEGDEEEEGEEGDEEEVEADAEDEQMEGEGGGGRSSSRAAEGHVANRSVGTKKSVGNRTGPSGASAQESAEEQRVAEAAKAALDAEIALHAAARTCTAWRSRAKSADWVLCISGLSARSKEAISSFCSLVGARLADQWEPGVTHLIMQSRAHPVPAQARTTTAPSKGGAAGVPGPAKTFGAVKRTLKFLLAVLHGQWILDLDWVHACLKAGQHVDEEAFEVAADVHGAFGGPRRGRLRRAASGQAGGAEEAPSPLFAGITVVFSGAFTVPSTAELAKVVEAGGGRVEASSAFLSSGGKPLPGGHAAEGAQAAPEAAKGRPPLAPLPAASLNAATQAGGKEPGGKEPGGRAQSSSGSLGKPKEQSASEANPGARGGAMLVVFSDIPAPASKFNKAEQNARTQRQEKAAQLAEKVVKAQGGPPAGDSEAPKGQKGGKEARKPMVVGVMSHLWILDSAAACSLTKPIQQLMAKAAAS